MFVGLRGVDRICTTDCKYCYVLISLQNRLSEPAKKRRRCVDFCTWYPVVDVPIRDLGKDLFHLS